MKTNIFLIFFFGIFLFTNRSFSQCSPDMSVTDPEIPPNGEIFPLDLKFKQTYPVNLVLTIIPPPTAVDGANTFTLKRIVLKSIGNKPSWMSYTSNASIVTSPPGGTESGYNFLVGTKYCVLLTGTPPDGSFLGTDSMAVIVDAYFPVGTGDLLLDTPNQNGGYIKFTVCAATDTTCFPTDIVNIESDRFSLLENNSTIFTNSITIGFNSEISKNVELSVFDILGRKIYNENIAAAAGENKFNFSGENLRDGVYIYIINDGKNKLSDRFIKSSK